MVKRSKNWDQKYKVLNLIITGIPSILLNGDGVNSDSKVLNLIITGIPSILRNDRFLLNKVEKVLNLIITGIPSIL